MTFYLKFISDDISHDVLMLHASENYNFERAQWHKLSTNCKFQTSVFSSKKVEVVWNVYHVCILSVLIIRKHFNSLELISEELLPEKGWK